MAVGTGFGQLFRGIGQVGGVAISSALFQSILTTELHKRIHGDGAEEVDEVLAVDGVERCHETRVDKDDLGLISFGLGLR